MRGIEGGIDAAGAEFLSAQCAAVPAGRIGGRRKAAPAPPALLQEHALDRSASTSPSAMCCTARRRCSARIWAPPLCRAVNDWLARRVARPAIRGCAAPSCVPMQDPALAVEEIERHRRRPALRAGADARHGRTCHWAGALLADLCGRRAPRPAVGIHGGSAYRHSADPARLARRYPSRTTPPQAQAFQRQLVSLISEGVFAKFPELKVVLMESGVTWLPALHVAVDKDWRGVRNEVPWVNRAPAAIVRDHVRLTVQPFDAPPTPADVERLMEHIGSDDMLLFASDYPHWQFDGDDILPDGLPPAWLPRILRSNALETYPRLHATVPA